VDGPQGPRGVIKAGLITMAQLSRVPIVPVAISVSRAWVLKSWDRALIPKPFSTVTVKWGAPIRVPEVVDDITFEETRRKIETMLREMQENADRESGWQESLF
jgi:lysophospholipid acyltransferase (LPLAT)-like uncharacterized protein